MESVPNWLRWTVIVELIILLPIGVFYLARLVKRRVRDRRELQIIARIRSMDAVSACDAFSKPEMEAYINYLARQIRETPHAQWTPQMCLYSWAADPTDRIIPELTRAATDRKNKVANLDPADVVQSLLAAWDATEPIDYHICLAAGGLLEEQRLAIASDLEARLGSTPPPAVGNVLEALSYVCPSNARSHLDATCLRFTEADEFRLKRIAARLEDWSRQRKKSISFVREDGWHSEAYTRAVRSELSGLVSLCWVAAKLGDWTTLHALATQLGFSEVDELNAITKAHAGRELAKIDVSLCMASYPFALRSAAGQLCSHLIILRSLLGVYHGPPTTIGGATYSTETQFITKAHETLARAALELRQRGTRDELDRFLNALSSEMRERVGAGGTDIVARYIAILRTGSEFFTGWSPARRNDPMRP